MSRGSKSTIDVLPGLVFGDRHEAVGRAAPHRAQRAFGCGLEGRMAAAVHQPRLGRAAMPSCLNWMRTITTRSRASARPTGTFQHCAAARAARRSRSATGSRHRRSRVPSEGVLLSVAPVDGAPLRVALVEQRGDAAARRTSAAAWAARPSSAEPASRPSSGSSGRASWCLSSAPRRSDRSSAPAPWRRPASARASAAAAAASAASARASSAPARASAAAACSAVGDDLGLVDDLRRRIVVGRLRLGDLLDQRLGRHRPSARSWCPW